jgi:hypothetical protein
MFSTSTAAPYSMQPASGAHRRQRSPEMLQHGRALARLGGDDGDDVDHGSSRFSVETTIPLRSSPRKRGPRAGKRKNWIPAFAGMSGEIEQPE